MEQVIATINYFVREKLWCSIRKLCDLVSFAITINHCVFLLGNEKRNGPGVGVLESLRHLLRRVSNRGDP